MLCLLYFVPNIDLRCTTCDDVLDAIEKTKKKYPQANFNRLTKQKGKTLPIEIPPSGKSVDYLDTEVKQNDASLDCLLGNATEGDYIKYLLQPTGNKYVTTDWTLDLCIFKAIVNSLFSTLSKDEYMLKNYTVLDFKNQMLIYILENYYSNSKLRNILNNHMAETLLLGGSLCTWVQKINRTMTWGDLKLINVISLMLNLKISMLDYAGGTANIVRWHFGGQKSIKKVDVILIYSGSTHFTGTGNFIINGDGGTHNTFFCTALYH